MKILVTGKNGQLGSELFDLHTQYPMFEFVFTDRTQLNLEDLEQISTQLNEIKPDVIINAAAYTAVDQAEKNQFLCETINHLAVNEIAKWANSHQAKVIHISTDYVFDGTIEEPLLETDITQPINFYGESKRRGEESLLVENEESIVIRTSWVYSQYGNNFVKTMMRLMNEREELSVVSDQIGAPTYARDLAIAILEILKAPQFVPGIYHYSNEGKISWYEFATAIKEINNYNTQIHPIASEDFATLAKRPQFSLLDHNKIKNTYKIEIPYWRDSLVEMIGQLTNK